MTEFLIMTILIIELYLKRLVLPSKICRPSKVVEEIFMKSLAFNISSLKSPFFFFFFFVSSEDSFSLVSSQCWRRSNSKVPALSSNNNYFLKNKNIYLLCTSFLYKKIKIVYNSALLRVLTVCYNENTKILLIL